MNDAASDAHKKITRSWDQNKSKTSRLFFSLDALFFETRYKEERLYINYSSDTINLLNWNSTQKVVNPILISSSKQHRRKTFLLRRNEVLLFSISYFAKSAPRLEGVAHFINSAIQSVLDWNSTQKVENPIHRKISSLVVVVNNTLWIKTHHRDNLVAPKCLVIKASVWPSYG